MRYLIEKIGLLCCILIASLLSTPISASLVLEILLFCSFSFLSDWVRQPRLQQFLCVLQVLWILLSPSVIVLLPLVCLQAVHLWQERGFVLGLLLLLQPELLTIVLSIIAFYLAWQTTQDEHFRKRALERQDKLQQDTLNLWRKQQFLEQEQAKNIEIATLTERNRLSHQLHDQIGHTISTSIMQLEALQLISQAPQTTQLLEQMSTRLQQGMDDIRQTLHGMYEQSFDFEQKMSQTLEPLQAKAQLQYQYKITSPLSLSLRFDLLTITKELTTNFLKHSNADQVSLFFVEQPHFYSLQYRDNGTVTNTTINNGIGILAMTEIVQKYHGELSVSAQKGYQLFIRIPKNQEELQ